MGDYAKNCVSDGSMGQQLPQESMQEPTFLPSVVTSLILIKDLKIKWSNFESAWSQQMETNAGSASVGWGPFAVSGHYSHHDEQRDFTAEVTSEGLAVSGIQLIGYVSTINPAAPGKNAADYLQKVDNQ